MLEGLFGNITIEKILFFLYVYGEGYPLGMARDFRGLCQRNSAATKRLENGGVVASRLVGKVRLYTFNPRYPFLKELKELVAQAYEFVPEKEKDKYFRMRKRPRGPENHCENRLGKYRN